MNASRTCRGWGLLLVTIPLSLSSLPAPARADIFNLYLADPMTPSQADAFARSDSAAVVFRTQHPNNVRKRDAEFDEHRPQGALAALTTILVLPPGLTPMSQPMTSSIAPQPLAPPPPLAASPSGSANNLGNGQASGSGGPAAQSSPEPAGLLLALTGFGMALVVALVRRKRTAASST